MAGGEILDDLLARGLIHDSTDTDLLRARLQEGAVVVYCGFDPTADSLHIGNLVPLLLLRRFQLFGHRPIALAGGATGMIGDPGGRTNERPLLDQATLDANRRSIALQLEHFLDFSEGPNQALVVDNRTWTEGVTVLDFLRDIGKHVTVNQMLAKESVKARVQSEHGISFTEFSYMLLQALDFLWLFENEGCELQVGGSDQWGNITAGIDLIRRRRGSTVHGLTVPLVTRADGTKFGKSEGENVWLSSERTSPYRLFQYLMQVDDEDVGRFLLQMTVLPVGEVEAVVSAHAGAPHLREAQRRLAHEVTALVHGAEAADAAQEASEVLFGGGGLPSAQALESLRGEIPTSEGIAVPVGLVDLLSATGLVSSRSDARRGLGAGEIWVGGRQEGEDRELTVEDLVGGRFLLLRRGKKRYHLAVVGS